MYFNFQLATDSKWATDISSIHKLSLPKDLMPRLGSSFLQGLWRQIILNSSCRTYVAVRSGKIVGFICYVQKSGQFPVGVCGGGWSFGSLLCKSLLFRPWLVLDILGSFKQSYSSEKLRFEVDKNAELLFMAMTPESQGGGVGQQLLAFSLANLPKEWPVIFVKTSSDRALKFYQKGGFAKCGELIRGEVHLSILQIKNTP